jgi:nucleoside 2-deoxyribosyltransferase|tara:strand:+ start:74 stop:673 length:600 start_codon:yes stop_codon:yes gene_type:complete
LEETVNKENGYTVYLAGELFDLKHIAGNALLSESLSAVSSGRYRPVLPQDLELPSLEAKVIRDIDYAALLGCDAAIFQFDGSDLDSGTVAEFMTAKFVDIPSVLLRTDFRRSGDRNSNPWNLMCDSFPRTESLVVDTMVLYSKEMEKGWMLASEVTKVVAYQVAAQLVEKLDTAIGTSVVLDEKENAEARRLIRKTYDL